MSRFIIILFLLVIEIDGFGQDLNISKNKIDTTINRMPEFPGGQDSLFAYLRANIIYPPEAKKNRITGKVYINFTVSKDGSIEKVKALNRVNKLLIHEAERLVRNMPKWLPGIQRGEYVSVSYNLPINFKLTETGKKRKKRRNR